MNEDMNNSVNQNSGTETEKLESERAARIKRMRGWMGVKGATTSGGHPDDNGPLLYGDGHSGWNR